jgi:hypothetical protein
MLTLKIMLRLVHSRDHQLLWFNKLGFDLLYGRGTVASRNQRFCCLDRFLMRLSRPLILAKLGHLLRPLI